MAKDSKDWRNSGWRAPGEASNFSAGALAAAGGSKTAGVTAGVSSTGGAAAGASGAAGTTAELREEAAAELAAAGASVAASTTAELPEEAAAELGEGLSCRDRVTIHENKDKDMVYKRLAKGNFEKVTAAEKTWLRKH